MARRSSRKRSAAEMALAAKRKRQSSSSGGAMWVWVLVAVIMAVGLILPLTGAFSSKSGDRNGTLPPATPDFDATATTNGGAGGATSLASAKPRVYEKLEPWRGLTQGMTQEEVRKLFGNPQKEMAYKGKETWEIYDDAEGSGILRSTGAKFGQWVVIEFDREGKVVTYRHYDADEQGRKKAPATP